MDPLKKVSGDKETQQQTHFGSETAGTTREGPRASADFFVYHLLHKKDVNLKISSRTVNCQLYQIKHRRTIFVAGLKQIQQRSSISAL